MHSGLASCLYQQMRSIGHAAIPFLRDIALSNEYIIYDMNRKTLFPPRIFFIKSPTIAIKTKSCNSQKYCARTSETEFCENLIKIVCYIS